MLQTAVPAAGADLLARVMAEAASEWAAQRAADGTRAPAAEPVASATAPPASRRATFIVFSGELDRLLMAFTLANGAAAGGLQTTMFFTFWGLPVLRSGGRVAGKGLVDRLFGWLLPRGPAVLPMSRLHLFGLGPRMIRWRMGRKRAASLEQLIDAARALGVRFVACEASLDLMGLRPEELLPGIELGGAAQCLAEANGAAMAMVI